MVVLFALGVVSIFWMAVVAAVVYGEKVVPFGDRLTRPLTLALVILGIWVAAAPTSVPGLKQPSPGSLQMK
jgi:predicted metal-binding membrane protein